MMSEQVYYKFFVLRILNGMFQGACYPAVNTVLAYWTPRKARASVLSLVYAVTFVGTSLSLFIYVTLVDHSTEYKILYYLLGAFGVVWCFLWHFFFYSRPHVHTRMNVQERDFLIEDLGENTPSSTFSTTVFQQISLSSEGRWYRGD